MEMTALGAPMKPVQFAIRASEFDLADLRQRLGRARWPVDPGNEDWSYGANTAYLRELAAHWRNTFDWRAQERAMNAYDHFRVEMQEGAPIHFMHVRGK